MQAVLLFLVVYDVAFTVVSVIWIGLENPSRGPWAAQCYIGQVADYFGLFSAPSPPTEENVHKR